MITKKTLLSLITVPLLLSAMLVIVEGSTETELADLVSSDIAAPSAISFDGGNTVGDADYTVQALVAGDLDNDGDVDLVSADGKIIGWENDATPFSGLWNNHAIGSPGISIYALVLGDLDNDGDLDVASGSDQVIGGYEVRVWQNDATPFDALWASNDAGNADAVLSLVSGDLDNDGDLDLVSGDDGAGVIAWSNDGTPFSGFWTLQTVGTGSTDVTALAVGDIDNDGDLDLVGGNAANRVQAWENDGTPFDSAWSAHDVFTTTDGIESLDLADVDGDGDLDILAGCRAGELYELTSWQNDGSPFTDAWTRHDIGDKDLGTIYALTAADFDVDGDSDLASGSQVHGTFAEVRTWENSGSPFAGTWSSVDVTQAVTDVHALATADLDRDGDPDLIAATSVITAWPNARVPGVWDQWTAGAQPVPTDDALSVALADFDHDGKLDIAAGTGPTGHGLRVWRGDGGYTWTQITAGSIPSGGAWPGVAWGQINNADELDVAAASQGSGLRAWIITQGGAVWDDASTGLPTSGDYQDIDLAHVNHDGMVDIVACGKGPGVRTWQNTGGTSWTEQKVLSDTLDFCDLAVDHVDHDGDLDIAAANCGNGRGIPVWLGDGSFGAAATLPVTTTDNYEAVAMGDVDNDGDADVVAAPSNVGGARIWLGDGGVGWTYQGPISPTLTILSLDLADFDNDGYLDILAGLQSGGVRVWRGDGSTTWTGASTNLAKTGDYSGVAFGRIDADAALDVVGAESGSSGVRVWTAVEPPPGGWADFQPATNLPYVWLRSQQVTCTVRVADVGSGLDASTAQYRFSRNGGTSWLGGWLSATVSGLDGTTTPQVMTATNVAFDQDSEILDCIQFRIQDMAGLTGTSPIYYVAIDTTPPTNPADLTSPDHTPGEWSEDQSIRITWTDEGSDNLSGIWGYSWVLDQITNTLPDETVEQGAGPGNLIDLWGIPDGDWTFHFTTRDRAGNWSEPAHLGPYRIDTADPTTPTLVAASHTIDGWEDDATIWISWDASDGGGIAGYSYEWHRNSSYYVDTTVDTTGSTTTSDPLTPNGWWYFHVRAIDQAGNAGPTAHIGPFGVDTTAPAGCWLNVPRYSNSATCLVEWSSLDADSGIASYDVQVRDDTYGTGTWEDWLLATVDTSTIYTDADLGVYSFRVRARDQAGNVSAYGCEDQTTVEDLYASDIEVTQGIQNLDNDAPLIADKTTYVRFYAGSSRVEVSNVDARLYGERGGSPLPGSPLRPTGGRITVLAGGGDRENLDDAFYFRLPSEWRSGTVELRAVVDPGGEIPEDEFHDNESTETVAFQSSGDFCIVMVPVHLHPHTYYIDDHRSEFWSIVNLMKWLYPVRNNGVDIYSVGTMYPDAHPYWHYGLPQDYDRVLGDLAGVDFWTTDPCGDTHYYGMVDPRSQTSGSPGMGERPGDEAAGVMVISRGGNWPEPLGGRIMAHELGHNFGRRHVWCTGCEENGGDVDNGYPYEETIRHTCESTATYTCRFGPDSTIEYYGFFPDPGGPPVIVAPVDTGDLMSYYWRRWPSDWTYRALLDELRDLAGMQTMEATSGDLLALSPEWAKASEYLFAAGTISPTGGTAELRVFYRTSAPEAKFVTRSYQQALNTAASDDAYLLTLEDAGGSAIYTHTFTATASTDMNDSRGKAIFAEVFPYTPAARIVLKQGTTELASRLVSAHAPAVTLLSPNGGETVTDHLAIAWTGSDADGDDLRYTVQYSSDDGATWRSLAVDWMATSFDAEPEDLDLLPGSDQARIRVTATDGVNTAADESDATFTVERKPPQATIVEPQTGSRFAWGDTVVLRGQAIDVEDGPLGETSPFTWTSNLSGPLGSGEELWVSGLPTGTHRITMRVTDSDGYSDMDEITIFVGMSLQEVYLPLVIKDYP